MILGATHGEILAFFIVLIVSMMSGFLYIIDYLCRLISKNKVLCFIYDLIYGILLGGIFVLTMFKINMLDVKYYHILALIIGSITGLRMAKFLVRLLRLDEFIARFRLKIASTKLYHIIKK